MLKWANVSELVSPKDVRQLSPLGLLRLGAMGLEDAEVLEISIEPTAETARPAGVIRWDHVRPEEDGRLSLPNHRYNVVFLNQLLERSPEPQALLRNAATALTEDGRLAVVASQMQPGSAGTYWSFSPLGMALMLEQVGFDVREFRAGIDGITLIKRAYDGNPTASSRFFGEESPLNSEIERVLRSQGKSTRIINLRKLSFAGLFGTVAIRKA